MVQDKVKVIKNRYVEIGVEDGLQHENVKMEEGKEKRRLDIVACEFYGVC